MKAACQARFLSGKDWIFVDFFISNTSRVCKKMKFQYIPVLFFCIIILLSTNNLRHFINESLNFDKKTNASIKKLEMKSTSIFSRISVFFETIPTVHFVETCGNWLEKNDKTFFLFAVSFNIFSITQI